MSENRSPQGVGVGVDSHCRLRWYC